MGCDPLSLRHVGLVCGLHALPLDEASFEVEGTFAQVGSCGYLLAYRGKLLATDIGSVARAGLLGLESLFCFIGMGLSVLVAFKPLLDSVSAAAVSWIIAEGVCYITGAVFYSLNKMKYMHSVFHFFVLAGSVCHIIAVWDVLMEYLVLMSKKILYLCSQICKFNLIMAYTRLTAAEAAALIKNGDHIAMSGFTPAGVAKATTKELAKLAVAEHEAGREFKVAIFTGASTGQSTDGDLANAQAILYRAPYTTNPDFRKHVNLGEIPYNDLHLSHMAQELRYGFYGPLDWAILEVCDIEEVGNDYHVFLTAAGGISPTAARLAKHVILELNSFHNPNAKFIHDVYEPLDPPYRKAIPIEHVGDRIGVPYVTIPKDKVAGVVECNIPDEARAFKDSDPVTDKIGFLTAEFLVEEMHKGRIPKEFLPLQSGVGSTANAILGALGEDKHVPDFNIYTEVIQNSVIEMMLNGRVKDASACSLTVSNECLMQVYDNMDYFKNHLTLRQSEISNSPEIIRRLGVIAINTAIEADLYGNVNSTHISGTKMMNGIGGSGDFIRNAYLSIFTCPSVAKGGVISSIVPFVSHQDSSEHDVNIIVTEQGVADLRGKSPAQRAECIIENCAHPDYKQLLWDYLKISKMGQTRHNLPAAFAMHDTLARKGDMKLTDFSEYVK